MYKWKKLLRRGGGGGMILKQNIHPCFGISTTTLATSLVRIVNENKLKSQRSSWNILFQDFDDLEYDVGKVDSNERGSYMDDSEYNWIMWK